MTPVAKATIQAKPQSGVRPPIVRPQAFPPARTIQRQKIDAQAYIDANGLGITASWKEVKTYVEDSTNDAVHRRGLRAAWNKDNARWSIPNPVDLPAPAAVNPFKHSNFAVYRNFTKESQGVTFTTPFGTGVVSARYSRGAPFLGSNNKNWPNAPLGNEYKDFIPGLRSGGLTDRQIATALLNNDDSAFASQTEKRAAAMLHATVYLAEEWRKQGAAKIFRAMLRTIEAGTKTFDDFLNDFMFVPSADEGRRMVGRFQDVYNDDMDVGDLPAEEQVYHGCLSPEHADDYSSDEEMRTDTKKNLASQRFYAEKYKKKK